MIGNTFTTHFYTCMFEKISDLNLCQSLWLHYITLTDYSIANRTRWLILAVISLSCLLITTVVNTYVVLNVTTQFDKICPNNKHPRDWLYSSFNRSVFTILSLMSGSLMSAIKVVNSGLFGIPLFDMGTFFFVAIFLLSWKLAIYSIQDWLMTRFWN